MPDADRSFVAADGALISYSDQGAGRPIVLIHGFPFHRGMWRRQLAPLSAVGRALAIDLRGFGRSRLAEADVAQGVAMRTYADDVAAMLDDAGVAAPAIVVGFSMGGYAAWQFALQRPERTAALVACDTRAAADAEEARQGRLKMAAAALDAGDSSPARAMLPKLLAAQTLASRPDVVAEVEAFITAASADAIAAAQRGMARREDVRGRLAEIACPVLGLVGAADAISPPTEMHEIVAALPHGRCLEIPDAGHSTPLENPAAVTEAIVQFVQSL